MEIDEHLKYTFLQFDPCPRAGEPMVSRRKICLSGCTRDWDCSLLTMLFRRDSGLLPLTRRVVVFQPCNCARATMESKGARASRRHSLYQDQKAWCRLWVVTVEAKIVYRGQTVTSVSPM
ncbi:hypothetical protein B0T24DRAFT_611244 [Lasiosphaeria ovina]|uniref:Uncharacterized protein n=1 Tax=Lasiosphaeria ovina TaxID=92902 RepID=A0AAE0KMA5_9PEZI|nr:hypothetical protein B0T24DRAFT_611244 [Lasiosphaeria ovina]